MTPNFDSNQEPSSAPLPERPLKGVPPPCQPALQPARIELGAGKPVNPGVFGANDMLTARNHILENSAYRALISALNIPIMRFPGGSHASFWDWERGQYIPTAEIERVWMAGVNNWMLDHIPVTNGHPIGTFHPLRIAQLAADLKVDLQWVPNLSTRADDQGALFTCLKNAGCDVSYVEMDNEAYFWGKIFGEADRGENYGRRVDELSPKLRQMFPHVKIGILAHEDELFLDAPPSTDAAMANWNAAIAKPERQANYDALILHHYVMRKGRLDRYETDRLRGEAFLAYPQVTLDRASREIERKFGKKPMWITEFNVVAYYWEAAGQSVSDLWMSSRRDTGWAALYQAAFWLTGLSRPDAIGLLNHHSIGEIDIGWGLGEPVDADGGMFSKAGQLYSHLAHLARTHAYMHPLRITGAPHLEVAIEGVNNISAAYGAALSSDDQCTLLVMNRGAAELPTMMLTPFADCQSFVTIYDANEHEPGPDRTLVKYHGPDPVWEQGPMSPRKATFRTGAGGELLITLPPFSLGIIAVRKSQPPAHARISAGVARHLFPACGPTTGSVAEAIIL